MPARASRPVTARQVVSRAVANAAAHFPDLNPEPLKSSGLDTRDARLALAIHRTVLQRWLTLEYLLDMYLRKPCHACEPAMRGVLLTAAAQLLFMDRLPAHAVIDESVNLAKRLVRPGAAGMVNAVLRRLSELKVAMEPNTRWQPARDMIPVDTGVLRLAEPLLPDTKQLTQHLSIATSHPIGLVRNWIERFGADITIEICHHNVQTPPLVVAHEPGLTTPAHTQPHDEPNFLIWNAGIETLAPFLAGHPLRRVQDVAASRAVESMRDLQPKIIVDYCAGRGTKTKQMVATWLDAAIFATDVDALRYEVLSQTFAGHECVRVLPPDALRKQAAMQPIDLLLLDVPCSNTAVLARRPEARYRYSDASVQSLIALQRRIVQASLPWVRKGGHVCYCTCSLDERENQQQVQWLTDTFDATLEHDTLILPAGTGTAYHDGHYHALLRLD